MNKFVKHFLWAWVVIAVGVPLLWEGVSQSADWAHRHPVGGEIVGWMLMSGMFGLFVAGVLHDVGNSSPSGNGVDY